MKLSRLAAAATLLMAAALPVLGQAPAPVRLGELDDRPVVDANGARIAEVYDVVVDMEEARAAYLVFSVGLKVVPVAMPSPEMAFAKERIELATSRSRLEGMPALDMAALGPRYKRGRDVVGTQLKDPKGQLLGDVKDLMIDLTSGSIAAIVVAFDPKVREDKGWVAIPRESLRYESGGYVATFNLEDMRPEAQARAEQRRFEAAQAAAMTVDRDERFTELKGRKLTDAQGKALGELVDVVSDAASQKALYALVSVAGGATSSIALPVQGMTRSGDAYVVPAGAAALAPPAGGGKRVSELIGKTLVDSRDKEVGKVRDVVVNLAGARVRYAVAEFEPAWIAAGYLVPIKVPGEDRKIELNALTGSMIFEGSRWPDINNPQFIANMDAYLARQK
jgi:sporulation protein YlmC with PRC-barrel domain